MRPATNSQLLLSVPVALSLFVVSDQLANLSRALIPMDENFLRTVAELVRADGPFEWLLRLAGIGVGAAVSEELLFRGVILTGFRRLGRLGAILLSALLFTAMHGLLLPNYFVAGVVLGLAASATGSILVPISIHLFHNVAALLLFNLAEIERSAIRSGPRRESWSRRSASSPSGRWSISAASPTTSGRPPAPKPAKRRWTPRFRHRRPAR